MPQKEAREKEEIEAAEKIQFGKKARIASKKIAYENYAAKPDNKARRKVLNEKNNKKKFVKARKKAYDQTDAAKEKRKQRTKAKQRRAALACQ